jgi:hypothetical protein
MLWSRPTRAQPPIVAVAKWTFAAARICWASNRVIQSAAEGIAQSDVRAGGFEDVPDLDGLGVPVDDSPVPAAAGTAGDDSPSEDDDPLSESDDPDSLPLSSPRDDELDLIAARRSFLAQPVPR